jgi:hypothetical protein
LTAGARAATLGVVRLIACSTVIAACLAGASPALAAPRISVSPNPVDSEATQTVRGRGWPVNEFCSRRVRISLRSDQNAVRLGFARVRRSGRFRFEWSADASGVGAGRWRLVARLRCESGDDGSPVFVRRRVAIRVR